MWWASGGTLDANQPGACCDLARCGWSGRRRDPLAAPGREGVEVALGIQPVVPLLAEDDAQHPAHGIRLGLGVARLEDGRGLLGEALVGEAVDDAAHGGHPVGAQREHLLERRTGLAVTR